VHKDQRHITQQQPDALQVIRNGQMLGVHERSSRSFLSLGSAAASSVAAAKAAGEKPPAALKQAPASMKVLGEARLVNYYNDGGFGTGTQEVRAPAAWVGHGCVGACIFLFGLEL
jgi:hypothetical protein